MKLIHGRIGGLAAAACLAAGLLGPASALAGPSVGWYKAEAHVDLDYLQTDATVSCKPGDVAMDGMWRVDQVDQDDDWGSNVLDSVDVIASYGDPADPSKWTVSFIKNDGGRGQAKVFVTCLPQPLVDGGHTHTWSQTYTATTDPFLGFGPGGTYSNFSNSAAVAGRGAPCPNGSVLIEPGFKANSTTDYGRLYSSTPSADLRSWTWSFIVPSGMASSYYTFSWRCLALKSGTGGTPAHSHKLVIYKKTYKALTTDPVMPGEVKERQISCGDHYKAIIAGFHPAGDGTDTNHKMWYLGMDPRPKTRAFSFLNEDGVSHKPDLYAVCFHDRTT